jgi:hypothetical protein
MSAFGVKAEALKSKMSLPRITFKKHLVLERIRAMTQSADFCCRRTSFF